MTLRKTLLTIFHALLPPLLFLPAGAVFAAEGKLDATRVPWILLVTEVLLLGWAVLLYRRWRPPFRELGIHQRALRGDVCAGLMIGLLLAVVYEVALSPALDWLRLHLGDPVPPGETRRAIGAAVWPFAIANILLAPFVEELLYRGLLEWRWRSLWGPRMAAAIGIAAFGLLHWAGGLFYIGATALVGAGLLALRRKRDSLIASMALHFAFNTLEVALSLAKS